MKRLASLAVLCLSSTAWAAPPAKQPIPLDQQHPPLGRVLLAVTVDKIVDGATVEGMIYLPYGSGYGQVTIRDAYNYFEPGPQIGMEVSDAEMKKGKAAMRALQELLDMGELYAEPEGRGKKDGMNRLMAKLWVKPDGGEVISVAKWMKEKGHAKPDKTR